MVGREMLKILEERKVVVSELIPVASERSIGKVVNFKEKEHPIVGIAQALSLRPQFALFSAGGETSLRWAERFSEVGTTVIDNSSAWRMNTEVPLVVPEINFHSIKKDNRIIANPNCSTIQLVMALYPLHERFGLKRVVVSTYQSVTGTGKDALQQLEQEERGIAPKNPAYPFFIHRNCIPHCDVFLDNGYTKEEMKLVHESRKILGIPTLRLTATAVRVPVIGGHSESVNVRFEKPTSVEEIKDTLYMMDGVVVQDNLMQNSYPMPLNAKGKDAVFVGRIRKDESESNTFNMWIVADNLRKGAATNAVQILEKLIAPSSLN